MELGHEEARSAAAPGAFLGGSGLRGAQLVFFADAEEERRVAAELAETALAKDPLPAVPRRAQ